MDDTAIIRTYGNPDLPEGTEDRPLVTFAVFAYNQEQYIREAVEGAFSQTYSPLEIILSDDCSSDRTFEIMEEMARTYDGPHRVRVRRGEINLGTALHVSAVAKLSRGELIVVAAGDDISEARRCDVIVKEWVAEGRPNCCIHSAAVIFDKDNNIEKFQKPRTSSLSRSECIGLALRNGLPFLSPTCAYTKNIFLDYPPLIGGSIIEDEPLSVRALATGRIISVNAPLVKIRKLENTAGTGYSVLDYQRWNNFVLSKMVSNFTNLRDLPRMDFDEKTKTGLQVMYTKNILRLSRFVMPTSTPPSLPQRIRFLLKFVLFYPSSSRFIIKSADAAKISGFSKSSAFRLLYWLFKRWQA